ncbi:hypothetical protein [Serratia sp. M24T3]|uniref:hypothetical protein n=1 Tax=Serratia sp. M24T3 TaxID=932213 RepID=UPI00025BBCB6|nr:hypothetical protein [Serratia sp. M24T3]EIC82400.1 hypothetical protein SPM24T3_22256 [Serratia sp. M24T3]
MPLVNPQNAVCVTGKSENGLVDALSFYNQFTQFIDEVRNAPVRLLSICGVNNIYGMNHVSLTIAQVLNASRHGIEQLIKCYIPVNVDEKRLATVLDKSKAQLVLQIAENKQLLEQLYTPSPFPPPESQPQRMELEVSKLLAFAGLSSMGIPAEVNPWVLNELIKILGRAGALTSDATSQRDKLILQFLSSQCDGRYLTGEWLISLLLPFVKHVDLLQAGLGTALYHIGTCNPVLILFPCGSKYPPLLASTAESIQQPITDDYLADSLSITLPGTTLYYGLSFPKNGVPLQDVHYWISPNSCAAFKGFYRQLPQGHCPEPQQKNGTGMVKSFAGASGWGRVFPETHQVVYILNTGLRGIAIETREQAVGHFPDFSIDPTRVKIDALSIPFARAMKGWAVAPDCVLTPSNHDEAVIENNNPPQTLTETLRKGLIDIDGMMSLFRTVNGEPTVLKTTFDWRARKPRSEQVEKTKLNRNPNIEQIFPDEYTYDAITRRYQPLFDENKPGFTMIRLVEKMLDENTRSYLLSDEIINIPLSISHYYFCASLDMSQQSRALIVNGFVKYILYLLKVERVFDTKDFTEIYSLLNSFHPLDLSLAGKLGRFIKVDSGSEYIDLHMIRIIAKLAFPFNSVVGMGHYTHEMHGWKLMLGLLLEQYFPENSRGRPLEKMNEFIFIITSSSVTTVDRQRFMRLLTHPPICFLIELMGLDILHERLIGDNNEEIIKILSEFNKAATERYKFLAVSSYTVVDQLYAFYKNDNQLSKIQRVEIIRQSLITAVELTLQFIMKNWFYQSSIKKVKLYVQSIYYTCWVKGVSRRIKNNDIYQGGVVAFEFNKNKYFFYIDDSAECSYLGLNEEDAKRSLLDNKIFFKKDDIKQIFLEKTGHDFSEIDGGITLLLNDIDTFTLDSDFTPAAVSFVDQIALSTPRKNKLVGNTFFTRMQDWYNELSAASFIPLWGCYEGLGNPQLDKIEKFVGCSVEVPTLSLLAHKSVELIKTVKSTLYFRPQDLFSDLTQTTSSSRTLLISPGKRIILSTEAPIELPGIRGETSASRMIACFHGSSVESFSSYSSSSDSVYYFGRTGPVLMDNPASPVRALESSASMSDLSSSYESLAGRITMNRLEEYPNENEIFDQEEDIKQFLDMMKGRIRDRQKQSIHATVNILGETANELLANIPHLVTTQSGAKAVAYSIMVIAIIEVFKTAILALYNEAKHGGYQDTNIIDFKLKFVDKIKLQLEMHQNGKDKASTVTHNISLSAEEARKVRRNGLISLPKEEKINTNVLRKQTRLAIDFNKIVMNSLLKGLPFPSRKMPPLSLARELTVERPAVAVNYFRTLSLESNDFLDLLIFKHELNDDLKNTTVRCGPVESNAQYNLADESSGDIAENLPLIEAINKYKNKSIKIVYPDAIDRQIQCLIEIYRNATVADYVNEYNRVHRMQFLRLMNNEYLNFSIENLRYYLEDFKSININFLEVTLVGLSPFNVTIMTLAELFLKMQEDVLWLRKNKLLMFSSETPADVCILLHQYFNASVEQRLAERATNIEQNTFSGLGIDRVKSLVTPYFTLPAELFFNSRMIRYGFARQDFLQPVFSYVINNQLISVTLMDVLSGRLNVDLNQHYLLEHNKMLKNEIQNYVNASESMRREERKRIELYYTIYRRDEVYLTQTDEFIHRIAGRYHAQEMITPITQVEIIDLHGSKITSLLQALDDRTDNSIISYPLGWPGEAANEFDVYRRIRYGNLTPYIP